MTRSAIVALLLVTQGCSFVLMRPVGAPASELERDDCERNDRFSSAVLIDGVVGVAGMFAVATDPRYGTLGHATRDNTPVTVTVVSTSLLALLSAAYGGSQLSRCVEAEIP